MLARLIDTERYGAVNITAESVHLLDYCRRPTAITIIGSSNGNLVPQIHKPTCNLAPRLKEFPSKLVTSKYDGVSHWPLVK